MHMFKKGLSMILAFVIMVLALSPAALEAGAAAYIKSPEQLSGYDYTGSDVLANALNEAFKGSIAIYSDSRHTKEVTMPVGYSMSKSTQYYVKSQTTGNGISGWQCYIYANAVYNKLFKEWVGHAEAFKHSRVVIPGGSNTLSYDLMRSAGVRCGAYLRTTCNSNGEYSSNVGHSMIILGYDAKSITCLEGNADGAGLIRVAIRTWKEFNDSQLEGRERYISHMVQPTDAYYQAQFPQCQHQTYEGCGVCSECGYVYDWKNTEDPWAQGIYRLTEKVTPRSGAPYSAAAVADITLEKDQKIRTTAQYRNAFDQIWYSAVDAKGQTFYVNGAHLKFVEYMELKATCSGFSPSNGAQLERKSHPVKGIITSNYPLKSITGYLDGAQYASWEPTNEYTTVVDLRQTTINQNLSFSQLAGGRHTVKLVVRSFVHSHELTVHESEFYIISADPCDHNYVPEVTQIATCDKDGILTYTCLKCDDSYTLVIAAQGHNYKNGACSRCSQKQPASVLKGSLSAGGQAGEQTLISLSQGNKELHRVDASSDSYAVTDILPGTYTMRATKTGCVPVSAELTLEDGENLLDIKVCAFGDVNGDHRLNIGDISKLYAHVRGSNKLPEGYAQSCADYNEDGNINIGDTVRLYSSLRQK